MNDDTIKDEGLSIAELLVNLQNYHQISEDINKAEGAFEKTFGKDSEQYRVALTMSNAITTCLDALEKTIKYV